MTLPASLGLYDSAASVKFLAQVNYYRFFGYFQYWQDDPARGDNQSFKSTSFETICALYYAEQEPVTVCDELLHPLDVLLRARFAYACGRSVGETGMFAHDVGFMQSPMPMLNVSKNMRFLTLIAVKKHSSLTTAVTSSKDAPTNLKPTTACRFESPWKHAL
ncbi:Abi family protein [Corynebacterium lowii]|uniref:Abi family protein n=1 Tax=Corynebacterium lowii TaxID=1544413 RepID=UPI00147085AB